MRWRFIVLLIPFLWTTESPGAVVTFSDLVTTRHDVSGASSGSRHMVLPMPVSRWYRVRRDSSQEEISADSGGHVR